MKVNNSYSKSFDLKCIKTDLIESLSKYFQAPLPNFMKMNKDPQELKEIFYSFLQEHRKKAKKAIKLARKLQTLSENYYETTKNLETMNESAEFRIEQCDIQIEEYEETLSKRELKIEELINDIEDLEKKLDDAIQEREKLKIDVQTLKKNIKQIESDNEQKLSYERKKHLKDKNEDARNLEILRMEITHKEKAIEETLGKNEKLESLLKQEKLLSEKFRADISLHKSSIFELKNKLEETKIKKSNYKDLYKEMVDITTNRSRFKNNSTQTSTQESEESKTNDRLSINENLNEENDLLCLEEEQSLATIGIINSIEVNNNFLLSESVYSKENKENIIYIIPSKLEIPDKCQVQRCESIIITPIKQQDKNYENTNFPFNFVKCARVHKGRYVIKPFNPKEKPKFCFSTPATPHAKFLSIETWSDSIQTMPSRIESEATTAEPDPLPLKNDKESIEVDEEVKDFTKSSETKLYKDPIKGYFVKVCQTVKASCAYTDKIVKVPTNALYNNLVKLKTPCYRWPEAVQEYLAKRLKQT